MLKRIRFWWIKQTDTQFQWGHPDDWNEAEWYYYNKESRG